MKQRFFSLFACAALLLSIVSSAHTAWADSSSGDDGTYTDPETGATFVVPEGWVEQEPDEKSENALVTFVSQKDSGSFFQYECHDQWNEIPESERFGLTRSDINNAYFYTNEASMEMFISHYAQLNADITTDDILVVMQGVTEYIEILTVHEAQGVRVALTTAMHVENGYVHLFVFSGFSAEAVEDFQSVLHSMRVPPTGQSGLVGGDTYTDPETGATFVVPEGWVEYEPEEEIPDIDAVNHIVLRNSSSSIIYGGRDLWNDMSAFGHLIYNRSEINNSYAYTSKTFQNMLLSPYERHGFDVTVDDIRLVTYGKTEYIELTATQDVQGWNDTLISVWHVENGHACFFLYTSIYDETARDFQSVLYSFQVPEPATPNGQNSSGFNLSILDPLTFLINLLLTFSVYTLPILFYRFVLNSGPSEKKSARAIVIFYGICAYLLMCWIMWLLDGRAGVSILFWSFVNYRILISGKKPEPDPADMLTEHPDRLPPATQPPAPSAPATPTPAAYVPAASAPAPSAPAAYIPAASAPAPSAPAAYPSAPPAPQPAAPAPQAFPQIPPTDQNSSSGGAPAPAAPLWPAQYSHAQDVRVGFAKSRSDRRAPVYTDTPYVPAASTPAASAPAAYAPAASKPVSPTPQAAPMTAAAPAAPAPAAYTPTHAPHTAAPTAPFIPEPTIPAAYPPAPPAPQTPPSPATPVPATPHTSPSSAVPQASAFAPRIQFCRNCGFQLLEDSKFCSSCGTPVVPVSEEQHL